MAHDQGPGPILMTICKLQYEIMLTIFSQIWIIALSFLRLSILAANALATKGIEVQASRGKYR